MGSLPGRKTGPNELLPENGSLNGSFDESHRACQRDGPEGLLVTCLKLQFRNQ